MLETDTLFKSAAANFKAAEAHLKDTEDTMRALVVRLEKCSRSMRTAPPYELPRLDALVAESRPLQAKELHLVNS